MKIGTVQSPLHGETHSTLCQLTDAILRIHPHVHGELSAFTPSELPTSVIPTCWELIRPSTGRYLRSSPRAWGTLGLYTLPNFNLRFIPTCMGNSNITDR